MKADESLSPRGRHDCRAVERVILAFVTAKSVGVYLVFSCAVGLTIHNCPMKGCGLDAALPQDSALAVSNLITVLTGTGTGTGKLTWHELDLLECPCNLRLHNNNPSNQQTFSFPSNSECRMYLHSLTRIFLPLSSPFAGDTAVLQADFSC